jgi:hypothetical protein
VAVQVIDGVQFKHSLDKTGLAQFVLRLHTARVFVQDRAADLVKAIGAGDKEAQGKAIATLMTTKEARLAAAIRANRALPDNKRATLERCIEIAEKLDLSKPIKEPVRVWRKPKSNGGYRIIHDPGLVHRTAQQLVRRVMDKHFMPRPFQFTLLGVQRAIKEVKKLVGEGYVYAAHLDIKDFYGSFELEKLLSELPLPEGTVMHAVHGRFMELTWVQDKSKGRYGSPSSSQSLSLLSAQARLGMPQGSGCSSIIGAHCVSRLKWHSTDGVALVNYVDDFLLLATSREARAEAVEELTEAVGHLPGGTFMLELKRKAHVAQGFTFLGHTLQLTDGELRLSPSPKALECFFQEMDGFDHKLQHVVFGPGAQLNACDKPKAMALLARYTTHIRGWRAAFQECPGIDEILAGACAARDQWLSDIGASEADLNPYMNPYIKYEVDGYALK